MEKKIPVRSEADPKYTWALEDVYANNDLWKADLEKARALPAQLAAYKGIWVTAHRNCWSFCSSAMASACCLIRCMAMHSAEAMRTPQILCIRA